VPLFRRRPLLILTIAFHRRGLVEADLAPGESRWPEHEDADRLVVPLALSAVALSRASEEAFGGLKAFLQRAAQSIAAGPAEPAHYVRETTGLDLVANADEPPETTVVMQLVRSPIGPIPSIGRTSHPASVLARASVVALGVTLAASDAASRLSAALTMEGLLGWYREADPQLQPPQQALAYSLRHARARLEEMNRHVPGALQSAIDEHRKINPMAGGAR